MGGLELVFDLAVILIAAGVCTIVSRLLKQPLILGYIVAGFLVGPHLGLFPNLISSPENIKQWSEIGIIFLLFGLGLEFSFKKLLKVGSSAIITAGTICAGMFIVGIVTASLLGWSSMEGVFLGGMLSMSSTTILIKTFDELGLKQKSYASQVFGILVVEDLIAVLLMVLLSTLAVSNKFAGAEMLAGLAKLLFFLALCFLVGIYVIPTLLKRFSRQLDDEILLILSVGMCFGMVALASAAGFSSALGAFVMGSLLAETLEGERIARLTHGIKNLFGAIFFVSVGMMVDPSVIGAHWGTILFITVIVMSGILIFATVGSLLAGQSFDNAIRIGFSLAQLGEFSFIIASVGCRLGVVSEFIYPVIITVSAITTFTTPYMIKAAEPVLRWLQPRLPLKFKVFLNNLQQRRRETPSGGFAEWKELLKLYLLRVGLYGVMIFAIYLLSKSFIVPLVNRILPDWSLFVRNLICVAVTLALMGPFLYGQAVGTGNKLLAATKALAHKSKRHYIIIAAMVLLRMLLAVIVVLEVLGSYFQLKFWSILVLFILVSLTVILAKSSVHKYTGLEDRFFFNLNEKENLEKEASEEGQA